MLHSTRQITSAFSLIQYTLHFQQLMFYGLEIPVSLCEKPSPSLAYLLLTISFPAPLLLILDTLIALADASLKLQIVATVWQQMCPVFWDVYNYN